MDRSIGRLSARKVATAKEPGFYPDGGGLYLQVTDASARSWIYRFMLHGRPRSMGLGSASIFSLAEARDKAGECRKLRAAGIDPIDARRERDGAARIEAARAMTFKACAGAYIEDHAKGWRNAKHGDQWRNSLTTYAYPVIGALPAQGVDVALITKILRPIWATKTETANRVRGRIEAVLDWATANGYRRGDNPARWRGHLDKLLPARSKVQKVKHHAALPYDELGAFMAELRGQVGIAPTALQFAILTATRTSETIGARWEEIDLDAGIWTVPADRIKMGKEHRIPLSVPALALLKARRREQNEGDLPDGGYVFPGGKPKLPLSNMAMLELLRRMGRDDLTVHGFRSSFKDWASERTNFPAEVSEMALAHAIDNKTEKAYRRGDLFEKRRRLMAEWAKFCATVKTSADVVPLMRAKVRP
jgi:integrase